VILTFEWPARNLTALSAYIVTTVELNNLSARQFPIFVLFQFVYIDFAAKWGKGSLGDGKSLSHAACYRNYLHDYCHFVR
jgi:hypothetical protein